MKIGIISLMVAGSLVLSAAPASAAVKVTTKITVKAKPSKLTGKVLAPLKVGDTTVRTCQKKRSVTVFMKKNGSFKRIARTRSAKDGSWSVRATKEGAVYKINIAAKKVTFSNSYGQLTDAACLAKTIKGKKVTASRFKIL